MTQRFQDSFLACYDCGVLHPVALEAPAVMEDTPTAHDDATAFAADHVTHRTSHLFRYGDDAASDRPLWDPLGTLVFQATDGEQLYVVVGRRESIADPRTYRFTQGTIQTTNSEVLLDDGDLRRALDRQFFPHTLRPTKLDRFISVVHDVVSHIPPNDLEIAFDDADDPAVSVARMPTESYQELLTRCTDIFDAWEWPRVSRFLRDNRGEDGLLALRVRRQTSLLGA
jgi:hypothetical protein